MLLSDSYRYKIPVYNRYGEYHCCGTRYRYHSTPYGVHMHPRAAVRRRGCGAAVT